MMLLTNAERIADIEKEISGVKSLYNINQFELDVMATLKKQRFGSPKQQKILAQIEVKVFGYDREQEEKRKLAEATK